MFEIQIKVIEDVATETAVLLNIGQSDKPKQRYEISANNLTSLNDVKLLAEIIECLDSKIMTS